MRQVRDLPRISALRCGFRSKDPRRAARKFASGDRDRRSVRVVTAPDTTDAKVDSVRRNYQRLLGGKVKVTTEGIEGLVDRIVTGTFAME